VGARKNEEMIVHGLVVCKTARPPLAAQTKGNEKKKKKFFPRAERGGNDRETTRIQGRGLQVKGEGWKIKGEGVKGSQSQKTQALKVKLRPEKGEEEMGDATTDP